MNACDEMLNKEKLEPYEIAKIIYYLDRIKKFTTDPELFDKLYQLFEPFLLKLLKTGTKHKCIEIYLKENYSFNQIESSESIERIGIIPIINPNWSKILQNQEDIPNESSEPMEINQNDTQEALGQLMHDDKAEIPKIAEKPQAISKSQTDTRIDGEPIINNQFKNNQEENNYNYKKKKTFF